jgi:hypothetical protein
MKGEAREVGAGGGGRSGQFTSIQHSITHVKLIIIHPHPHPYTLSVSIICIYAIYMSSAHLWSSVPGREEDGPVGVRGFVSRMDQLGRPEFRIRAIYVLSRDIAAQTLALQRRYCLTPAQLTHHHVLL